MPFQVDDKTYNTFTDPPRALAAERAKASFPVREMTYYLDGGEGQTRDTEELMQEIERDPLFSNEDYYDLTKEQQLELTFQRVVKTSQSLIYDRQDRATKRMTLTGLIDASTMTRCGVHYGLFLNAVRGQGTDDQFSFWVQQGMVDLNHFFGCFGMTELGHGSNVAGLETTSTYDSGSDEFIINTPTLAATKWWIGGAAHAATHCVVFARLLVDGKDYGVKQFVTQLRDTHTHTLQKGIALGDIGKKMGRDGIDNGWIQFSNVRVPRQNMLMRYTKVARGGKVTVPPIEQLSYGALITGRVTMVLDSYLWSKRFLTIAIRYGTMRRQFGGDRARGEPETSILDYPHHQRRLLPRLAFTYAMNAVAAEVFKVYDSAQSQLEQVDVNDKKALGEAIRDLKELFAVSAGLKAFCTWGTAQNIDECRQACGGHGYSGYNGFGRAYDDWVVQCTWEGDNNILMLSAGRAVIQTVFAIERGEAVGEAAEYLTRIKQLADVTRSGRALDDPRVLIEAYETAAARAAWRGALKVKEIQASGKSIDEAMNEVSQVRFLLAQLHSRLFLIRMFFANAEKSKPELKPVLMDLARLFALWSVELDGTRLLSTKFFEAGDMEEVDHLINTYNAKLRPEAVALTDAFNLSDYFLNSPIANNDGNLYKNYFAKVTSRYHSRTGKAPYYKDIIDPLLHRETYETPDIAEAVEDDD